MNWYRDRLPQLEGTPFITDGGIETTLIFHDGLPLPDFAAFDLLRRSDGNDALRRYFRSYADIARRYGVGLLLETATWRASADWGARLGYAMEELSAANRAAVSMLEEVRAEYEDAQTSVVISGCIGPRGDGYTPGQLMSAEQAVRYHAAQAETFADSAADMVTAITMNYVDEAIGVVRAARGAGMPVVVSFTVETNGRLITGESLDEAVTRVDRATGDAPAYYMVNCAHPTHFSHALQAGSAWVARIRGIRANASTMSHAELNEAPELDEGNPEELGGQYAELVKRLPGLTVMGGCCGTDHRHVDAMARACTPLFLKAPRSIS